MSVQPVVNQPVENETRIKIYGDSSELRISESVYLGFSNGHYYLCDFSEDGYFVACGLKAHGTEFKTVSVSEALKLFWQLPGSTIVFATNNGLARFLEREHIGTLENLRSYFGVNAAC